MLFHIECQLPPRRRRWTDRLRSSLLGLAGFQRGCIGLKPPPRIVPRPPTENDEKEALVDGTDFVPNG